MSDGDRDGSVFRWIRTLVGRIRNGGDEADGRGDKGENEGRGGGEGEAHSDPLDGVLAQHEREKMDDIIESASEENSDDDRSNG